MAFSLGEFVQGIRESGLLSEKQLSRFRETLDAQSNSDVEGLAKALVKAGRLTKYQVARILKGRHQGLILGNNAILEKIGEGGMGAVFRARHQTMKRDVAVKILNESTVASANVRRRFEREVQAAAQLIHPNIVAAFDASEEHGRHFLVMEYVDGTDLQSHIEQNGPLSVSRAIDYVIQAGKGLHYAHRKGIIHRDIKPSNLLLNSDDVVKILDMGLARFSQASVDGDSEESVTRDNQIVGTADYISPEQVDDSKRVDQRSDIYSLGCTFFYLLTGEPPFFRSTLLKTLLAHKVDPIPSLNEKLPDVPTHVAKVIEKMLAKNPGDRYPNVQAVVDQLQHYMDEQDFELIDDPTSQNEDTAVFESGELSREGSGVLSLTERSAPVEVNQLTDLAVGIDLGTTFSAVSYLDDLGRPQTLVNSEGDKITPSVVLFDHDDVIVGKEAIKAMATDMDSIAECAKRDLGHIVFHKNIGGRHYPPQVILAYILRKLRCDAQTQIGDFDRAVITVPAYFDEGRRKAVQEAGYLAGIDVLDIINEPTAAAIAYGFQKQNQESSKDRGFLNGHLLVYDLGGGTFDVTVMEISKGDYIALATDGDVQLGGRDWDERLVDFAAEQFFSEHGLDPRSDSNALGRLLRECEDVKRTLSARSNASIAVEFGGKASRIPVSREFFEQITNDLLGRTEFTTRQTLKAANLTWNEIDRVLLVGGSTRMPAVSQLLESISGIQPDRTISPDEAVANGAAIRAGMVLAKEQGTRARFSIKNVNSHSLGLVGHNPQTQQKQTAVLIKRNTHLPAITERIFRTKTGGQSTLSIRIVEGESSLPDECSQVGKCVIRDLPPNLPARTPVHVRFQYEENGRLTVKVKIQEAEFEQEILRENSLTVVQLESWKKKISSTELA